MAQPVLLPGPTFWEGGLMAQMLTQSTTSVRDTGSSPLPNREKALKILSKSIYKDLRQNGYEPRQIVALASEIISLVTSDIKDDTQLD
ncbi:MAG: hypothetical protein ABUS79_04340 [Pseudomonadota bacterium]